MEGLKVSVEIEPKTKAAEDFGGKIAEGLEKQLRKLKPGSFQSEAEKKIVKDYTSQLINQQAEAIKMQMGLSTKLSQMFGNIGLTGVQESMEKSMAKDVAGGGMGGNMAAGIGSAVTAGLVAAGVVGFLKLILDVLGDLPIIKGIMKILGVILTLLFLPLIPILKPVLLLLADFVKVLAPVMKQISVWLDKLITFFEGAIGDIAQWIWNLLVKGWDILKNVGQWVWDQIIKPGLGFLSDLGIKIWNFLKTIFVGTIDAIGEVWNFIKSLFVGTIDVAGEVWNFIKSLFGGATPQAATSSAGGGSASSSVSSAVSKATGSSIAGTVAGAATSAVSSAVKSSTSLASSVISTVSSVVSSVAKAVSSAVSTVSSVVSSVAKGISSIFGGKKQLGGVIANEGMFMLHRGERVTSATERSPRSSQGPMTFNISIDKPQIRSDQDIKNMVKELDGYLKREMRRRVSYT